MLWFTLHRAEFVLVCLHKNAFNLLVTVSKKQFQNSFVQTFIWSRKANILEKAGIGAKISGRNLNVWIIYCEPNLRSETHDALKWHFRSSHSTFVWIKDVLILWGSLIQIICALYLPFKKNNRYFTLKWSWRLLKDHPGAWNWSGSLWIKDLIPAVWALSLGLNRRLTETRTCATIIQTLKRAPFYCFVFRTLNVPPLKVLDFKNLLFHLQSLIKISSYFN